jgi:hypothetical protein
MSNVLLNLLVQFSKTLVYSKIQFLIRKDFFSTFGLWAHTAQLAVFFLLPHRSRARKPPPPAGKITTASLLLHFPIKRFPSPSSIPGNRHLQSGGIEAPSTSVIEGRRPPLPHPHPIKGCPALSEDPHTSSAPSLSPHHALTTTLPSRVLRGISVFPFF